MRLNAIIPILYSSDVTKSISYYTEVLGFEDKWEWGDPPTFGGIYKNGIEIFFCEKGQGQPGTWLSIMVDDVDGYYELIKAKGATIVSEPKSMEWGIREMLVQDPDGHMIRFGQAVSNREKRKSTLPETVRLVERMPTAIELDNLAKSVGWGKDATEPAPQIPGSSIAFVIVAEDMQENTVIGCAFLLTDHTNFYYVKNVIINPAWQGKRIGTALMKRLSDWADEHAPEHAMVALHTGEQLAPFYKQFGFDRTFSMQKIIKKAKT